MKLKKSYVKDVIEIVAAFLAAWLFYQGLAFATGTPMPIVAVVSQSMEPVLHRGDLLVVVGEKEPQIGDIVIYQSEASKFTIVHRIIKKENGGYIIKGDNNAGPDPGVVSKEQIIGKAVFAVPLLGYPRLALYAVGI